MRVHKKGQIVDIPIRRKTIVKVRDSQGEEIYSKTLARDLSVSVRSLHSATKSIRGVSLHRYLKIRQRMLNLPDLHYYDIYPELIDIGRKFPADEAIDLMLAAMKPLGDGFIKLIKMIIAPIIFCTVVVGIAKIGAPGSTAAVALLTDAVKKGGAFASSSVGGLSGAFIPVSEDAALADAVGQGHLVLEKLEAMTSVCSVGLDMVAIPGDTPAETRTMPETRTSAPGVNRSRSHGWLNQTAVIGPVSSATFRASRTAWRFRTSTSRSRPTTFILSRCA